MSVIRTIACGIAVVALLCLSGCGPGECADQGVIEPGSGVTAEGASLCLGDTLEDATKRLGEPSSSLDLGTAGVRLGWDVGVVGHLASSAEDATVVSIELVAGVDAATAGGVGVGSSEADLRAELGDPIMEPFTGAWLYPDRGIAVQWQDGAVSSVHLFAP